MIAFVIKSKLFNWDDEWFIASSDYCKAYTIMNILLSKNICMHKALQKATFLAKHNFRTICNKEKLFLNILENFQFLFVTPS